MFISQGRENSTCLAFRISAISAEADRVTSLYETLTT